MINQFSATLFELLANRLLELDAESDERLKRFADKTIHIGIDDLSLNYFFLFPNGNLIIKSEYVGTPSASIRGKASAYFAAATADNTGDSVFSGDLHFSGEINTAQKFQQLIQSLQFDWQEPVSQIIGDSAAHFVGQGFNHLANLAKNHVKQTQQDIPEYLQEELRVTPGRYEVTTFSAEVDVLRSQTERLAARLQRLQAK